MLKTIRLALGGVFAAGAAFAGAVAYVAPAAPEMIEEAAPMGSSGAWIIPLIAVALVIAAVALTDDDEVSTLD